MAAHVLSETVAYLRRDSGGAPRPSASEHRSALWIEEPFPATVRGVDATGERFEECAVLDGFSPWDLSLRLARPIARGARLFVAVRLSTAAAEVVPAPCVALRGVTTRVERRHDGRCGLEITFTRHRFVYVSKM
jgi:hypothetical protein